MSKVDFVKAREEEEAVRRNLERQATMERQAHLYDDQYTAENKAFVTRHTEHDLLGKAMRYRYNVAERGSWWVVECRRINDNALVDIL